MNNEQCKHRGTEFFLEIFEFLEILEILKSLNFFLTIWQVIQVWQFICSVCSIDYCMINKNVKKKWKKINVKR
jgi:hypothetical protein